MITPKVLCDLPSNRNQLKASVLEFWKID